ncbi:MFS transporter [Chitinimonas sp. BJYL2]|uniref:MFS transporter n=1 Tax=Chitinimonas sp. BJYL2 TaxID=2976696 RepID=UPI0022B38F45|nr:MFS transporter [Chitinimonas sp. BJYL2]
MNPSTPTPPATSRSPWFWVPSLYFYQGLPYFVVTALALFMWKDLGVPNDQITLYMGWLGMAWVLKPFWAPLIDLFHTKRRWIVAMQALIGIAYAMIAFTIETSFAVQFSLAMLLLVAFSSATHDIAADGFYMLPLKEHEQAAFVGVRSTFFRLAKLFVTGGVLWLVGHLINTGVAASHVWAITLGSMAALSIGIALYHQFALPRTPADHAVRHADNPVAAFLATFVDFLKKPGILVIVGFLLFYRFGEANLQLVAQLFLVDTREAGGLGLSKENVGLIYGVVGAIALTLGGLLGGWVISRHGLKKMLWPMIIIGNVPHAAFVWLAWAQPTNLPLIATAIGIEQFAYGFSFTAYLIYMIMIARGENKTAHYAICTGFMALSMTIPGFYAGKLQLAIGYTHYFIWVCIAVVPTVLVALLARIDGDFGKKQE